MPYSPKSWNKFTNEYFVPALVLRHMLLSLYKSSFIFNFRNYFAQKLKKYIICNLLKILLLS